MKTVMLPLPALVVLATAAEAYLEADAGVLPVLEMEPELEEAFVAHLRMVLAMVAPLRDALVAEADGGEPVDAWLVKQRPVTLRVARSFLAGDVGVADGEERRAVPSEGGATVVVADDDGGL